MADYRKNLRLLELSHCITCKQSLAAVRSRFTDLLQVLVCEEICGEEHKSPEQLLRIMGQFQVLLEKAMYCSIKSQSELEHKCLVMPCQHQWQTTLDLPLMKKVRINFQKDSLLKEKIFHYFLLIIC